MLAPRAGAGRPGVEIYLAVAIAILMGVAAAGVVLSIKIARRRNTVETHGIAYAVPARPLSREHAERMMRGYFWTAAMIVALVAAAGLAIAAR